MDYKSTQYVSRDTKVLSCLLEELNKRIRVLSTTIGTSGTGGGSSTETNTLLQEIIDALETSSNTIGFGVATNGAPVTIPDNVKGYSIVNLGENAAGLYFSNIALTGDLTATIPASLNPFGASVERGVITNSNITVTPAATHQAAVTWIV